MCMMLDSLMPSATPCIWADWGRWTLPVSDGMGAPYPSHSSYISTASGVFVIRIVTTETMPTRSSHNWNQAGGV